MNKQKLGARERERERERVLTLKLVMWLRPRSWNVMMTGPVMFPSLATLRTA